MEISKWMNFDFRSNRVAGMAAILFSAYIVLLMPNLVTKTLHQEIYGAQPITAADFHKKQVFAVEMKMLLDSDRKAYFLAFDEDINSMLSYRAVIPNKDIVPYRSSFDYTKYHTAFKAGAIRYIIIPSGQNINSFMDADFKSFTVKEKTDLYTVLEYTPEKISF